MGTPALFKARLQNFKFAPGGNFAPIHNRDYRRRRGAAPFAITIQQRFEQLRPSVEYWRTVNAREALHHGERAKTSGQEFRSSQDRREIRRCIRQTAGNREEEMHRGARPCWMCCNWDRDARGVLLQALSANCASNAGSLAPAATTRSPRRAMVSATSRTRFSSCEVRKNGRRNGQWRRSPKVSLWARIRALNSAREFAE